MGKGIAKSALVTGVTGQDGSYLAEFLLSIGYTVPPPLLAVSSKHTMVIGEKWGSSGGKAWDRLSALMIPHCPEIGFIRTPDKSAGADAS